MPASFATSIYAFMGLPLVVILGLNIIRKKPAGKIALTVGCTVSAIQIFSALIGIVLLLQYNKTSISFSQFWDMKAVEGASFFSVDVLSLTALFAIGLSAFAAFNTAKPAVKDKALNFTNLVMVLLLGMNGIALVTDLFSLFVFMEITAVVSFVLISFFRTDTGIEGSFKYLVLDSIAAAFILLGTAFIFITTKSLQYATVSQVLSDWDAIANPTLVIIGCVFLIAGLAVKAGLVPFHGWLPDAYQGAPAPVAVLLGGIVTKMAGVYAIIRIFSQIITNMPIISTCLMVFALISVIFGSVAAINQQDMKRILAYSSISQTGYIIIGVTCGNVIGFIGAVLHFFNHVLFKTTLFVDCSAVQQQAGTTDITKLGGLQKQMPFTSISSMLAFLSAAGIPPLSGFWSKLLIIIAAWQAFGIGIASIALLASLLTAAYFLRLQRNVFFGPYNNELADIKEAGGCFKFTETMLSAVTVIFGIGFPVLLLILQANGVFLDAYFRW